VPKSSAVSTGGADAICIGDRTLNRIDPIADTAARKPPHRFIHFDLNPKRWGACLKSNSRGSGATELLGSLSFGDPRRAFGPHQLPKSALSALNREEFASLTT
jgi:hypothetical protein